MRLRLRLLEFLAPEIGDSRLIVVGTYRPTELSRQHPLSDALGAMARAPQLARVSLAGLTAEEVHDFVAAAATAAGRRAGSQVRSTRRPREIRCSCARSCAF